jgi:hypothetical protein
MTDVAQIEGELLGLPPPKRERLALRAWKSLLENGEAASDPSIDPAASGCETRVRQSWSMERSTQQERKNFAVGRAG